MPSVPRIRRAIPDGPITRPPTAGIPVIARLHWQPSDGITEVQALATAWTRHEVEIVWDTPEHGRHVDWIPASDVQRASS